MKSIYILFETDQWLTKSNSTILAVCTSKHKAFNLFEKMIKNRTDISIDDKMRAIEQMVEQQQTQCLLYNCYIEEYYCNKMIL